MPRVRKAKSMCVQVGGAACWDSEQKAKSKSEALCPASAFRDPQFATIAIILEKMKMTRTFLTVVIVGIYVPSHACSPLGQRRHLRPNLELAACLSMFQPDELLPRRSIVVVWLRAEVDLHPRLASPPVDQPCSCDPQQALRASPTAEVPAWEGGR